MAQNTAGVLRIAAKDANGNVKRATEAVDLLIADNTTSPRLVFTDPIEGRPRGTINDEIIDVPTGLYAASAYGEWLDVEVMVGTTFTLDTSDMTAVVWNVADIWKDNRGEKHVDDLPLRLADRVTRTVAGTFLDPSGLEDDLAVPANVWHPVLRYMPRRGHTIAPRGYGVFQVHDNAA